MTWFLPERELHLHKLSWRPRESSREEVSPGPGSSTPSPRTAVQRLSQGQVGLSGHTRLCPDHPQHGAREPSASQTQIITLVSTPVTPVMQATLGVQGEAGGTGEPQNQSHPSSCQVPAAPHGPAHTPISAF